MLTQEQKSNVSKLIAALKSGEYIQGQGALTVPLRHPESGEILEPKQYTYCCLGVAGKILGLSEEQMENIATNLDNVGLSTGGFLSPKQAQEFGFDDAMQQHLAHMNDEQKSFLEIADEIENFLRENS